MPTANRRNIVMGKKTWERLRAVAKHEERSISDIIREAVIKLLDQRDANPEARTYNARTDRFSKQDF